MTHELKTLTSYFKEVTSRTKNFEIRKDDRNFEIGDSILLLEIDSSGYTGKSCRRNIKYILRDAVSFGLRKGFVVLGIE